MRFIEWLKLPYPFLETIEEKMAIALLLGIIVTVTLAIFQPFDIRQIESVKYLIVLGYGAVTTVSTLLMTLLVSLSSLRRDKVVVWSIGKQVLFLTTLLLCIAMGNWLFTESLRGSINFHPFSLIDSLIATPLVGVIPISITLFYSERVLRKRHSFTAESISQHLSTADTVNDNEQYNTSSFPYDPEEFLYAKSEGNYIQVYLCNNSTSTLVRQTMKELEKSAQRESSIVRCHRSYMVNLSMVSKISGDARGYIITLKKTDVTIPISRNHASFVLDSLASL